jgi:predicted metal-dependent peptidase
MEAFLTRISSIYDKWFLSEPLYFNILVTHKFHENNEILTLRTGKRRIEYNIGFVSLLSDSMLEEHLKIEIIRILLKHPYQRQPPIKPIGYFASDITITDIFPTNCHLLKYSDIWSHDLFRRSSFEKFYQELEKLFSPAGPTSDSMRYNKGIPKSTDNENITQTASEPADQQSKELNNSLVEIPHGIESDIDTNNLPDPDQVVNADLWEQDDLMVEEINSAITAAQLSQSWGSIPGNIIVKIIASLNVRTDYRKVLRRFRHSILSEKRTLTRTRPNRRYEFDNMGSRYRFCTKLLVAVDTSGSVSDIELQKAFSIINRLFKYGIEACDVLQFDTEIKGVKLALKRAQASFKISGRGGTDFQCIIDYLGKDHSYDGLIIITDGYAPVPSIPPRVRTRIVWLFNSELNFLSRYNMLCHIGQGCFLY